MYELTGQFVGSSQAGGGPQLWLAFLTTSTITNIMAPQNMPPAMVTRKKNQELPCRLRYTRLLSGG